MKRAWPKKRPGRSAFSPKASGRCRSNIWLRRHDGNVAAPVEVHVAHGLRDYRVDYSFVGKFRHHVGKLAPFAIVWRRIGHRFLPSDAGLRVFINSTMTQLHVNRFRPVALAE